MTYLEINDLIIDKYKIDLKINKSDFVGFIGKSEKIKELFLFISGINPNNQKILHEGKDVYENNDYFKKRVLIDFRRRYISTLRKDIIKEAFNNKFDIDIDTETFMKKVNNMALRKEAIFNIRYNFTPYGNTILNYCLISSINIKNIMVLNPFYKVENNNVKKEIVKSLGNKKKISTLLIEANDLKYFNNLDYFVLLTDDNIKIIDKNSEVIIFYEKGKYHDLIYKGKDYYLCLNTYSKDELKDLSKSKYKKTTLNDYFKHVEDEIDEKK